MNSTASSAASPGPPAANSPHARDGIDAVEAAFLALLASPTVRKMLDDLKADEAATRSTDVIVHRRSARIEAPRISIDLSVGISRLII